MVSRASTLALVLVLMSTCRAAAEPTPAERETARSLMVEGDRLRDAGDHAGALSHYQSAHALMHVPTTGLAVAQARAQLGHLVEARSAAIEVMSLPKREHEPAVFAAARRAAAALAASLEPRVASLQTTVSPAGADYTLQVDEVVLPESARAVPFKTNPGEHTVQVSAPGYEPTAMTVTLGEGASESLSIELQRTRAEDEEPASAPLAPQSALVADVPSSARAADADGPSYVPAVLALGLGGAALATGIVTGTLSWVTTQDEKKRCRSDGQCAFERSSALSRANTLANIANISVPLGLIGVAIGVYALLRMPDAAPARERGQLRLDVTPAGVQLRGSL